MHTDLNFRRDEGGWRLGDNGGYMNKIFLGGVLALFCAATIPARAALLYPFLEPLQVLVASNIAGVTNRAELSREERQQLRALIQAENLMERRVRASLVNDVQVLATISTQLRRSFPDGDFDLLLSDALAQYRDVVTEAALTLGTNVSQLPQSTSTRSAAHTLENTLVLLERIDPTDTSNSGVRSLVTAALRLRALEAALSRLTNASNRGIEFTARINGRVFRANTNGVSITYNPAAEFMTITGREVSGIPSESRTITLYLADVTTGTTSHFFGPPSVGTYATYSEQTVTNSASFISISGHATVSVNATTGEITGRFSFEAGNTFNRSDTARVTSGNFSTRTQ